MLLRLEGTSFLLIDLMKRSRHIPENNGTKKVKRMESKTVVKNGIGFGSVLAITISWSVNHIMGNHSRLF